MCASRTLQGSSIFGFTALVVVAAVPQSLSNGVCCRRLYVGVASALFLSIGMVVVLFVMLKHNRVFVVGMQVTTRLSDIKEEEGSGNDNDENCNNQALAIILQHCCRHQEIGNKHQHHKTALVLTRLYPRGLIQ